MTGQASVRRGEAHEVWELRHEVLRPHQGLDEVHFAQDQQPTTAHFCAEDSDGKIVCVASVWPEPPPWPVGATAAWRLRAMATAPAWRGRGVGGAVLRAAIDHIAASGGGLLWCNARLPAVGFYERAGLATFGDTWEEPVIGPHVAMWRLVEPGRPN